jgi:hypothetical protein
VLFAPVWPFTSSRFEVIAMTDNDIREVAKQAVRIMIDGKRVVLAPRDPTSGMLRYAAEALLPDKRPCAEWMSVKRKHKTRYRAMLDAVDPALTEAVVEMREALVNYRRSVELMQAAMKDGLNVQGALSEMVAADEAVDAALARITVEASDANRSPAAASTDWRQYDDYEFL